MTQRDDSNSFPHARFVEPGKEHDDLFDAAMRVLGITPSAVAVAADRGYAVRTEQGQRVDRLSYGSGFLDALSLLATLRASELTRGAGRGRWWPRTTYSTGAITLES